MTKANWKKMLSLILTCVMTVSILAGCGNEKEQESSVPSSSTDEVSSQTETESTEKVPELEPVTLKWYVRGGEKEGSRDVEEAFNALLAEVLPNTTVEFTFVTSYSKNWAMFISGGEEMDIAWNGSSTPMLQDAMDGNLMPLDDLIEEYAPNLQADRESWPNAYETGVYEGVTYAIPCVQPIVHASQYINVGVEFYEYMDVDAFVAELRSNTKMTYKMLDILEDAHEAGMADGVYKIGETNWGAFNGLELATRGYMPLGAASNNMWFDPEAENPVPMHLFELPEVKMLLDRYAKWYDKGWFTDTVILDQLPAEALFTADVEQSWTGFWGNADENGIEFIDVAEGNDYYRIYMCAPEDGYIGTSNFGSENTYYVIPYTAKNPERAMMVINLLHDEVGTIGNELYNMLAYGFEKDSEEAEKYGWFNYAVVDSDDGQKMMDVSARGDAANMHSLYNWTLGNTYRVLHDGGENTLLKRKEYAMNYYEDIYPLLKETPLAGMTPNYNAVANEVGNVNNAVAEYEGQLKCGVGGVDGIDALYDKAMSALKSAGLDTIKAEMQAQIDAYMNK